jgi:hypothetical protein
MHKPRWVIYSEFTLANPGESAPSFAVRKHGNSQRGFNESAFFDANRPEEGVLMIGTVRKKSESQLSKQSLTQRRRKAHHAMKHAGCNGRD